VTISVEQVVIVPMGCTACGQTARPHDVEDFSRKLRVMNVSAILADVNPSKSFKSTRCCKAPIRTGLAAGARFQAVPRSGVPSIDDGA
jgi:hypothetical protein